jgi:hypothetical protein
VVGVRVGEDHGVDVVDVLANRSDRVEVVPRIHHDWPLTGDQKRVAREATLALGEIRDHVPRYAEGSLVAVDS